MNAIVKVALNKHLFAALRHPELVESWWHIENKAFDNKTPDQVYQSGEEGRKQVANYIINHRK